MPYLTAAVVLVGLLCALDLLLTVGVIRRLREHSEALAAPRRPAGGMVAAGSVVDDFDAVDTNGDRVTRDGISGDTLVGFFSPGCEPCEELQPRFAAHAARLARDPAGRPRVLAVLVATAADKDDVARAVELLSGVARVVVEDGRRPLSTAFRVDGYPTVFRLDAGGRVLSSGVDIADDLDPVAR